MKKLILSTLLIGSALVFTGCVGISIGGRSSAPPLPPAPVIVSSPDAATMAEIDAAARLSFDSSRLQALTQIAQRPGMSPGAQIHLVNVAYRRMSFSDSKVTLLRAIIANPDFCDSTRHAIVSQLHHLSFDSNKQIILNELNERLKHRQTG